MGILDKIIDHKQADLLQKFEPTIAVGKILEGLKERERKILSARFGLLNSTIKTLEVIGKEQGLTRERVRQIEKSLLKSLRSSQTNDQHIVLSRDLFVSVISDHGGIIAEDLLFEYLRLDSADDKNSVIFILHLIPDIEKHESDDHIEKSWAINSFSRDVLHNFIKHAKDLLETHSKPLKPENLIGKLDEIGIIKIHFTDHNPKMLENYLRTSKVIKRNAFGDFGLVHWNEIQPKDVGDKAYLVMKHHGKPEHYTTITELINKYAFDSRKAFKETVHNELIKDKRFILVGRGIYALSEWGYTPGVVSDVIKEILKEKGQAMTRDQIVEEVLKRRVVKKNTILVGLSNKKIFKKVGKNLYALAE